MPSQVFLSMTPGLREFLRDCRVDRGRALATEDKVDMDEIYRLADEHQKAGGDFVQVHELLEGAEVVGRVQPPRPAMTELEKMRVDAEERKYQRMVEAVAPDRKRKSAGDQVGEFSWATNFGTQVIVAFIGAFALGYFFVEVFVAPDNQVLKVIAGAACSFCTLLVETCLLMVHETKERMIESKHQEREERAKNREKVATAKPAVVGTAEGGAAEVAVGDGTNGASMDGSQNIDDAKPKGSQEKKED